MTLAEKFELPLMALRDVVIFPNNTHILFVGRKLSLAALEYARQNGTQLIFVTQREAQTEMPGKEDLYAVGCVAEVREVADTDTDAKRVLVAGLRRIHIDEVTLHAKQEMQLCAGSPFLETEDESAGRADSLRADLVQAYDTFAGTAARDIAQVLAHKRQGLGVFTDSLAAAVRLPIEVQQELLENANDVERASQLLAHRKREQDVELIEVELLQQARSGSKDHRRDYLRDRAANIQTELGEHGFEDVEQLRRKINTSGMGDDARIKCLAEVGRLATMSPMSPEASVIRSYLDVLLGLPWKERTAVKFDLPTARKVLDADHKGLDKVKQRIIEYLAVQQKVGHNRGSVLCLLGPPGVGKTSLGKSIAQATGRQFVRLALGGIHDEATIRGHRRTYVASMPGRILKSMGEAKVLNPVFMLDEIDKLDVSFNGDPMAALLEVIDPEQNNQFVDQYAEVEFDLSEVMFIATANSSERMYSALRDRLEIIELPGYTDGEKIDIARQHLVPKLLAANGLPSGGLRFSDTVLKAIVRDYTKEAGVRDLERHIAKVCRKVVLEQDMRVTTKARAPLKPVSLTKVALRAKLGPQLSFHALKRRDSIGIVNGLAVVDDWEGIVHQIDAVRIKGEGGLVKTGNLMPHIEQSIDAACAVLRANPSKYGLAAGFLDTHQVHIHYPRIDVAHDGNSNGLALFTLLVSVLNDIPVRVDTAITGAINLRGEACAIGGLREKLVGAWRERIYRVIVPHIQVRELADIPRDIADEMEIIPVRHVNEVLPQLLTRMPELVVKRATKKDVLVIASKLAPPSSTHPH